MSEARFTRIYKDGGGSFIHRNLLHSPGTEATEPDFSIARILATDYCAVEPFKDTQEGRNFIFSSWATFSFLTIGKTLCAIEEAQ